MIFHPSLTPRRRRFILILAGLVILYAIMGLLVLPPILRSQATKQLSATLDRPVVIEKVAVNPFALSLTVRGFSVTDRDGAELAGFDEFHANFQLSSAFRWMWFFREVRLERPRGRLVVGKDGQLNIADLIAKPADEPDTAAAPAAPPRFLIGMFAVNAGSFEFHDQSHSVPFETTIGPVSVELHQFGIGSGEPGSLVLNGRTESDERFAFDGLLNLEQLDLSGRLTVTGLNAPKYDPFHHDETLFEVAEGRISVDVRFDVNLKDGLVWRIDPADFAIENLRIRERGVEQDVVSIPVLRIAGVRADSAAHSVTVASVALDPFPADAIPAWTWRAANPSAQAPGVTTIRLTRQADGGLDLAKLFEVTLATPATVDTESTMEGPAWSVSLIEAAARDVRVEFTDLANARPVHLLLDQITVTASNLSTDATVEIPFDASLRWQEHGTVHMKGRMRQAPLHVELDLEAGDLGLRSLEPYLEPWIDVIVTDGAVRASGSLIVSGNDGSEPSITFTGAAGLDRLAVLTTSGERPLIGLGSVDLRELRFTSPPVQLDIAEILVDSPALSLLVESDGSLNLAAALKTRKPAATNEVATAGSPPPPAEGPKPQITIGRVVIKDARADVMDHSVKPEFVTSLRDFGGTISGLSSDELSRADVDLKGTLDGVAPFVVSGTINPLGSEAFTDIRVDFRGIELPAFTPYSGRYLGYTIGKGKVTLDLSYRLSSRVLEAENKLTFDQFYLGDNVESPDAVSLPLKLALALLRDRSGKIDIDLPIRGNLDDPDFRYGSLVWKAVGNLIMKATTAPFALLGRLIPGGDPEELSYVAFAPGSGELDAASVEKLSTLANALYDRPALTLEIGARTAALDDTPPLRAQKFTALLVARKIRSLAATGTSSIDPSTIVLDDEDRAGLVRQEFAAAFPAEVAAAVSPAEAAATPDEPGKEENKPGFLARMIRRIFGGASESEPAVPAAPAEAAEVADIGPTLEEMEARLLEGIEVNADELQTLASNRAITVRDHLLTAGKVEAERLFLATASGEGEEKPATTGPRVNFTLK